MTAVIDAPPAADPRPDVSAWLAARASRFARFALSHRDHAAWLRANGTGPRLQEETHAAEVQAAWYEAQAAINGGTK